MCEKCDIWSLFDGPGSKCSKCQVTKSASIETRETNGVQYFALKSAGKQEAKPYFLTLMERFENV